MVHVSVYGPDHDSGPVGHHLSGARVGILPLKVGLSLLTVNCPVVLSYCVRPFTAPDLSSLYRLHRSPTSLSLADGTGLTPN